jgi:hypothetical protein
VNREAHRHRGRARERVRGGSRGGKQGRHLVRPSSQLDLILPLSDGPRQQVSCSGGWRARRQRATREPEGGGRAREKAGCTADAHDWRAPRCSRAAATLTPHPARPDGRGTPRRKSGTPAAAVAPPPRPRLGSPASPRARRRARGERPPARERHAGAARWRGTRVRSPKMKGVYSEKELMSPRAIAGPKMKAMRHHDIPIALHTPPRPCRTCAHVSDHEQLRSVRGQRDTSGPSLSDSRHGAAQEGAGADPRPRVAARQPDHVDDPAAAVRR